MDLLERATDSPGNSDEEQTDEFAPGTYRQSLDGTTARFQIDTEREHKRIRTLMYETEVLEDVIDTVSADDVYYDIGANIGVHTCFVGQHASRVVAFEPHGETAAKIRENAELNDVDVTVFERALADENGTATLTLPDDTPQSLGTGEFTLADVDRPGKTFEASLVRGDDLASQKGLPSPDVAKVDVEGAELATLDGFASTLRECRVLYVEVHLDHVSIDDVREQLRELDFEPTLLKDRGNTAFLRGADGR